MAPVQNGSGRIPRVSTRRERQAEAGGKRPGRPRTRPWRRYSRVQRARGLGFAQGCPPARVKSRGWGEPVPPATPPRRPSSPSTWLCRASMLRRSPAGGGGSWKPGGGIPGRRLAGLFREVSDFRARRCFSASSATVQGADSRYPPRKMQDDPPRHAHDPLEPARAGAAKRAGALRGRSSKVDIPTERADRTVTAAVPARDNPRPRTPVLRGLAAERGLGFAGAESRWPGPGPGLAGGLSGDGGGREGQ